MRHVFVEPATGRPTGSILGKPAGAVAWTGRIPLPAKLSKISMFTRCCATRGSGYAGVKIRGSPMPAKKSALPPEVFQLKVTLLGTMPPIWRRLLVPADLKLAQLHDVLQAAMGWQDCHMHEFSVGQQHFGKPNPEDRLMGMDPVENERTV